MNSFPLPSPRARLARTSTAPRGARPSLRASLLGTLASVLLAGPALAQGQLSLPPLLPQPIRPSLPAGPPQAVQISPPVQPRLINQPEQHFDAPARPPMQPEGGFGVIPPSPGKEDPTSRMYLKDASAHVKKVGDDADGVVRSMTNGALPNPGIQNESDLVELQQVQRQMQLLDAKEKLAEIAVKYWGTVYNNENVKAFRETEIKNKKEEDDRQRKVQEAEEQRQKLAALAAASNPANQLAAAPKVNVEQAQVYDIIGGQAGLIWPNGGLMYVRAGDKLPDGNRVASIANGTVSVKVDDKVVVLPMAPQITAKK